MNAHTHAGAEIGLRRGAKKEEVLERVFAQVRSNQYHTVIIFDAGV